MKHNPELARRALAEAWSAVEQAEGLLAAQLRKVDAAMHLHADEELVVDVVRPARPTSDADFSSVVAYTNALVRACHEIAGRLAVETARLDRARFARRVNQAVENQHSVTASLRRATAGTDTSRAPELDFDLPADAVVDASVSTGLSDEIDDLVARLPTVLADDARTALLTQARDVLSARGTGRAELLLRSFRQAIRRARRDAESAKRDMATAEDLLARSRGLEGSQLRATRLRLESVLNQGAPITREELSEAQEVIERARTEADRSHAARLVVQALGQLGYSVDESFSTLNVEDGVAYFSSPASRDHRVRLVVHDAKALNLNVVRVGDSATPLTPDQRRTDKFVEEAWCESAEALPAILVQSGLETEIVRRRAAGELPIQVISPKATSRSNRATGGKATQGGARRRERDG